MENRREQINNNDGVKSDLTQLTDVREPIHKEGQGHEYHDVLIFFVFIIVVLLFFIDKITKLTDKVLSKKYFRWIFSGVILPGISLMVIMYISPENQKFVVIAGIIISLVVGERASGISSEKSLEDFSQEKNTIIDGFEDEKEKFEEVIDSLKQKHDAELEDKERDLLKKNDEIATIKDELSKRVNELRVNYLHRLFDIAADHQETDCTAIKLRVKSVALEIMTSSCLLLSMDGVDYEARNNQVPMPRPDSFIYEAAMQQVKSQNQI